jgi:hypothetical protein
VLANGPRAKATSCGSSSTARRRRTRRTSSARTTRTTRSSSSRLASTTRGGSLLRIAASGNGWATAPRVSSAAARSSGTSEGRRGGSSPGPAATRLAANGRCRAGNRDADCQEPEHQDEHVEKRPRRRAREPPVAEPPQPARKHDRPAGGERDGQDQCGGAEPDGEEGEPVVQRPVAWANPRTPVSACRTYRRAARRPGAGRRPAQRGPRAVTVSMLPAIATATASAPVPPSSRRRLTKPARNYTSASTAATASAQPTIPFSLL